MISVLIADDEYWIREGLKTTIEWEKYGFYIVGDAADANEAYEKYKELKPQLIISDIRMEKTSGLDLISRIHSENPETEFIILSGYQQFDYAKKAFESGTFAYLLKPIECDILIETIEGVRERIKEKQKIKEKLKVLEMQTPVLKTMFYNDVMSGGEEYLKTQTETYNLSDVKNSYVVAAMKPHNKSCSDDVYRAIQVFSENNRKLYDFWYGEGRYYLIVDAEVSDITKFEFKDLFFRLNDAVKDAIGDECCFGISDKITGIAELSEGYNRANAALDSGFNSLKVLNYYVSETNDKAFSLSYSEVESLIEAINDVNYKSAKSIIDRLFDEIKGNGYVTVREIKNVLSEMFIITLFSVFKNKSILNDVFGEGFSIHETFAEYATTEELYEGAVKIINKIFEDPNAYLTYGYNPKIQLAISTVMMYYSEQLTVESVAHDLDISASYLMMLFKQEMGTTFNAYLTEYRIKVAVNLLKSGEYKIYEISEMVGYKDPDYFIRVFKKVTGSTPKKYIKKSGGGYGK